jgi:hypothetical protein
LNQTEISQAYDMIVTSHLLTQQSPFSLKKRANYHAHQHSYVGGTTGPHFLEKRADYRAHLYSYAG